MFLAGYPVLDRGFKFVLFERIPNFRMNELEFLRCSRRDTRNQSLWIGRAIGHGRLPVISVGDLCPQHVINALLTYFENRCVDTWTVVAVKVSLTGSRS